ncbi:MAG: 4Fe-4S binding protein [Deltaproteobacteria bacterium]|nr:4Fe-4S binding protein [Deltaproteobacteria bacterium]
MTEKSMYQNLAESIGAGESKTIAGIFEKMADENEAKILLAAAPPATVEEIAQKTGLKQEEVEKRIDPLFRKGLLFKSKKGEVTRYYRVRNLFQLHDSTAVTVNPPPGMLELWKIFMETEFDDYSRIIEQLLPAPAVRVIPVNISINPETQILAFDDIKTIVANARNLAVTPCSCRLIDGKCGQPVEVCVQIDKAADYALERGTGRRLEKDEALRLMKMCEEEGLVHVSDNKRAPGHVICNCCSDCCLNWPSVRTGLGKFVVPSRFRAKADSEKCSSCGTCLDRCHFEAISLEGEGETAVVNPEKCMGCGVCLVTCPEEALCLEEVRPAEFIPV